MQITRANTGKLEAQLQHWGRKLDELEAEHSMARAKLDEHELVGSEKWAIFEGRVESAWGELEVALGKLES